MRGVIRGRFTDELGKAMGIDEVRWVWADMSLFGRLRNKAKLRPVDLADPRNTELRGVLQKAEFTFTAGDDVVDEDEGSEGGSGSPTDDEL